MTSRRTKYVAFLISFFALSIHGVTAIEFWLTSSDLKQSLSEQPALAFSKTAPGLKKAVVIDEMTSFQTILGLGSSLEPTTCSNFFRMAVADREALMERIVDPQKGIGMNLMRLCIGTPDFTGDSWYSYCDLPPEETDPELKRFSIERDRAYILPIAQLARRKSPALLFFASPWSPPGWMKSNSSLIGGYLLPRWYGAYARYFVRYVQAYEAAGIPIYAVTVQNEPGVDRSKEKDLKWHYPSCHWTADQERDFIREYLGPAFRQAHLTTRIWCYDHNYNLKSINENPGVDYPRTILHDSRAAPFVDGVAFHGYQGEPSAMTLFHQEFPKTRIHFSEGSVFGVEGAAQLIDRLRNWAVSYNAWVLMLDDQGRPNNGPFDAKYATVALDSSSLKPKYLFDYFAYGQFMKFIPRGAVRLESRAQGGAPPQVVFRTPEHKLLLVAANVAAAETRFEVQWRGEYFLAHMPPRSIGTWRWTGK